MNCSVSLIKHRYQQVVNTLILLLITYYFVPRAYNAINHESTEAQIHHIRRREGTLPQSLPCLHLIFPSGRQHFLSLFFLSFTPTPPSTPAHTKSES